jgi:hypothetical protein
MRPWSALLRLAVVATVAGTVAAGPLAPDAHAEAAPQHMAPADVERWLAFWDKLVVTVVQAQATCDKLATDVSAVIDKNKPAIAIARTARAEGKKLPEAAQQHMLEGVKQMVPVMQRCGQHDKVRAAFAKLDVTRK